MKETFDFHFVSRSEVEPVRQCYREMMNNLETVPGTRSFHLIKPQAGKNIINKYNPVKNIFLYFSVFAYVLKIYFFFFFRGYSSLLANLQRPEQSSFSGALPQEGAQTTSFSSYGV